MKIESDFIIINKTPNSKGALWTPLLLDGSQHSLLRLLHPTDNHGVLKVDPGKWEQFMQNLIYFLCPPSLLGLNVDFFILLFFLRVNFIAPLQIDASYPITIIHSFKQLFLESNKIVFSVYFFIYDLICLE